MKMTLAMFSLLLSITGTAHAKDGVIYGDDNRLDLFQVTNSRDLALADSTVLLIESGLLTKSGNRFDISGPTFGREYGLCPGEPFWNQPSPGFCSGALVGEDLVLTAGHCITNKKECADSKFVFGFAVTQDGKFPKSVPEKDVVGCASIIARKEAQGGTGPDFAVIKLDRKITHHVPLPINRGPDLKDGDSIGVIGYPNGIPTKVAFGPETVVRSFAPRGYFVANVDSFGGNSGSPVFNQKTGLIEGILVRGEDDFVEKGGCMVLNVCTVGGCRGEDVTKISEVVKLIPLATSRGEPTPPAPSDEPGSSWPSFKTVRK